jgi:hypothetical protein
MTKEYEELMQTLSTVRVTQILSVVTKSEDVICFRDKEGTTHWDDEPDFEKSLKGLNPDNINSVKAEVSYKHYFGFTSPIHSSKPDYSGQIYFQMGDFNPISLFGYFLNQCGGGTGRPPLKDEWIAGQIKLVPGKGLRFRKWCIITPLEAAIHRCLLEGKKLPEDQIVTSENCDSLSCDMSGNIFSFARLIVNEQVEYYLDLKRRSSASNDAAISEKYMYRQSVDTLVYQTVHSLRPDLWEQYKEISLNEKLYSGLIPKPAPLEIKDNLSGTKKKVGLCTPFTELELKN